MKLTIFYKGERYVFDHPYVEMDDSDPILFFFDCYSAEENGDLVKTIAVPKNEVLVDLKYNC